MCVSCGENMRETDDEYTTDISSLLYMVKYSHTGLEQVIYACTLFKITATRLYSYNSIVS